MINDKMQRLMYFIARKAYTKEDNYIIINKTNFVPDKPDVNNGLLELLSPCPRFCSNFLVINTDPKIPEAKKVINLWIKLTDIGNPIVNKDGSTSKKTDGRFSLTKSWLRNIIDDSSLFSNVKLSDNTSVFNATSRIIFVGLRKSDMSIFVSDPVGSSNLVTIGKDFYTTEHKNNTFEKLKLEKKFVDDRPIMFSKLVENLKTSNEQFKETNGFYSVELLDNENTASVWWLFNGTDPKKSYPHNYKLSDYADLCKAIPDKVLYTSAAVCKHSTCGDKKSIHYEVILPSTVEEIFTKYKADKPELHSKLKGPALTQALIEWVKRNYPEFPLYPNYSWLISKSILYYDFKEKIN